MKSLVQTIKVKSGDLLPEITGIRRHLHKYPELSKKENNTAAYIAGRLEAMGIPYRSGVAGTGIVAVINGDRPGKTVALRADMDALPIREKNEVVYKSLNEGVMHACGHDVHMSCLVGAAKILNDMRKVLPGKVKLIFQPSEETYPGGAKPMIGEGVLKNPDVDIIFGQHVYPELEAGMIGLRPGKYMASTDEIFLTVHGKGGHGAIPDKAVDPVLILSHIMVALQSVVSRNADPTIPTVVTFGKIMADGRTNIIPDTAKAEGIIRTFDEKWRKEIHQRIKDIAGNIAEAFGGSCDIFIDPGYPYLENEPATTDRVRSYAAEYLGQENVVELQPRMTAEDFAYFLQQVPGCFYRLGVRNEKKGINSNLHSATFDVDESSLETGMGLMAYITFMELQRLSSEKNNV